MNIQGKKFGRYTLERLIARGGMGEVYLAKLAGVAGFEKRCIIKKIRPDLASDPAFVERFLNEGKTLVALAQSNIVQIFDMGQADGEYYLAMEYVSGGDLRCLLKNIPNHRVSPAIAVGVILEVLRGLSYAHRASDAEGRPLGIVHRDISPSNILISKQGEVKLIDFGIAKARTVESAAGTVQGKFAYMSPEQARGEKLDCRTDIFSAGVVFYEMLSGVRPYEGSSDLESIERIKTLDYVSLTKTNHDVDAELDAIVSRALEKNRGARYQSADAFFDSLVLYTQMHHISVGQREIMSYFKPYIYEKCVPQSGSVDDVMNMALDEMLNAQDFRQNSDHTSTIAGPLTPSASSSSASVPKRHHSNLSVSKIEAAYMKNAANLHEEVDVDAPTGEMAAVVMEDLAKRFSSSEESGEHPVKTASSASLLKAIERTLGQMHLHGEEDGETHNDSASVQAESGGDAAEMADSSNKADSLYAEMFLNGPRSTLPRSVRLKRIVFKLRYVMLGVLLGSAAWVLFALMDEEFYPGSRALQSLQTADVQNMTHASNAFSEAADNGANDTYIVSRELNFVELSNSAMHLFADGLPLKVQTAPQNATIYPVEASYRSLEGKNITLQATQNAVIAVQAPGYETCLVRLYFDGVHEHLIDWERCRSVDYYFDMLLRRAVISANLNVIRNVEPDTAEGSNSVLSAAEAAALPSEAGAEEETVEKKPNVRIPKKTQHSFASPSPKADQKVTVSRAVSISGSSAHAELNGHRYGLPGTVSGEEGEVFRVVPDVSGRQIGIAYQGKLDSQESVSVAFCHITVRIRESYVDGDPAPYQISDIFVDGDLKARQTDSAQFVLPCGKHVFSAVTKAQTGRLSGSFSADLVSGTPLTQSLSLASDKRP